MRACGYCGRDNADDALHCRECGSVIPPPAPPAPDNSALEQSAINRELVPKAVFETFLIYGNGFHFADWAAIDNWITKNVPELESQAAWEEAAWRWAEQIREDLGGSYRVTVSRDAILLSDESPEDTKWLHRYIARSVRTVLDTLAPLAWQNNSARKLFLVFAEEDDYFHYIAHFSPDGEQASSGGMCINTGYTHIAFPMRTQLETAPVIAHELVHHSVAHLPLPLWLNEALAVTLQRAVMPNYGATILSSDESVEHSALWNEKNIQSFWAGTSFSEAGDASKLSYQLAEVFLNLIMERANPDTLRAFVEAAHHIDAGQTAALDVLGADLGDLAGTFLGPGAWRPNRKAMVARFESFAKPAATD